MKKLIFTPFRTTKSVLLSKFEFDVISNRIAVFVSPFELQVFPPLNFNFLDCLGTHEFSDNFIAYSENDS